MKAIILAGGYGRRLYPLTENWPKPLLSVAGKPMLERVLESLLPIEELRVAYIVTNGRFYPEFCNWLGTYSNNHHLELKIINNRSTDFSHELGALGNLHLVLEDQNINDDIIVIAADNLFSNSLNDFAAFAKAKNVPVVATYDIDDLKEASRFGSLAIDEMGQITFFEEKPVAPKSTTIAVALYYYPQSYLRLIREYVVEHHNAEEPGRLIEWMYKRVPVYTWLVPGTWCDVGSEERLEYANRLFAEA